MYESFFGMEHTPFARDVPPESLYESENVSDILGRLAYVADRQLFAVLTADAGCGKSTLIRKFTASLNSEEYIMLYLSDSKLTPRWFYKGLLDQIGIEAKFYRGDAKRQLQRYAAIRQRIDMNCVIHHLDRAEVERYIRSHLEYAGGAVEIFTSKALDIVARESSGIPRMINRICEKSLMYAFQKQKKLIDDYMVTLVVENEIAH